MVHYVDGRGHIQQKRPLPAQLSYYCRELWLTLVLLVSSLFNVGSAG